MPKVHTATITESLTSVTGDIVGNIESWRRHLRAENKSPKTIETYVESARQFAAYLQRQGMPTDVAHIKREHAESFITHLLEQWKSSTANNRYRGLQQFFRWLVDEGEIKDSPLTRTKPPKIEEEAPDILSPEQIKALLATCEKGQDFEDRRDAAMIRLFLDSGARRTEVANLRCQGEHGDGDVDLDHQLVRVMGKGRKERILPIGAKTAKAIDRYLRIRGKHPHASLPWLWLGRKGQFTSSGIEQILRRRGRDAGLGNIHPHQFRHTFAHVWQADNGNETDLMYITGWSSRTMLNRYAKSAAGERARNSHRRMGLGDRY